MTYIPQDKLEYRRMWERERKQNPLDVPIGIVAHHKRLGYAYRLVEKLDAEVISIDEKGRGPEWNHKQMLKWMRDGQQEWTVILEDDAIPAPNFRTQLEMALHNAPTPFVGLYLGTNRHKQWQEKISQAVEKKTCWVQGPDLLGAVGYAFKTKLIPSILSSLRDTWDIKPHMEIDAAISEWGHDYNIPFCFPNPSLVDHRDILPVKKNSYREERSRAWVFGHRNSWDSSTAFLEDESSWETGVFM